MTTPTHDINVPLARRILAQIVAAPRRWTQAVWLTRPYEPAQQAAENTVDNCKTSGCFAGWAVVLSGHKTTLHGRILNVTEQQRDEIVDLYGGGFYENVSVRTVATVELGLTTDQAAQLFEGDNTYRDIVTMLHGWTGGEIELPDTWPEWADMTNDDLTERFLEREGPREDDEEEA